MGGDWLYSTNEETYYGGGEDTAEAAARVGFDEDVASQFEDGEVIEETTVFAAHGRRHKASEFAPEAQMVTDALADNALDGEFADPNGEWLSVVSKEAEADLDQRLKTMLDEWADKHGLQPKWQSCLEAQAFIFSRDAAGVVHCRKDPNY